MGGSRQLEGCKPDLRIKALEWEEFSEQMEVAEEDPLEEVTKGWREFMCHPAGGLLGLVQAL